MNTWIVYKHTSPSNKVYIGITSINPKYRWGCNGNGYKTVGGYIWKFKNNE